jgi:glutamate formiminotransferase
VRAIGLDVTGSDLVQVSMNLTDYRRTGLVQAFQAVRDEAARLGVEVEESRIIGLAPAEALAEAVAVALRSPSFAATQILERAILDDEEDQR